LKSKIIGTPQNRNWDEFAEDYSNKIYSITKSPFKRQRILAHMNTNETILIAGAGSEVYLQKDIIEKMAPKIVIAGDLYEKMIEVSKNKFRHGKLKHEQFDTKKIPYHDHFNTVISTNSIVPATRNEVTKMFASIYKSLHSGGKLIAYLPSYDLVEVVLKHFPELKEQTDPLQSRVLNSYDWQCYFTNELIKKELKLAGFSEIHIEKVGAEDSQEKEELNKIFKLQGAGDIFWEYFVVAQKSELV